MVNVYTEEEAKEKTCCNKPGRCIASGCMAWRQYVEHSTINNVQHDMSVKLEMISTAIGGYCGLGGKP
jgi:hypothetical protein